MGLYRLKESSIWWISFSADGKQYRRSTETDDKELAKRILKSIEGRIAEGKWFPETRAHQAEYTFTGLAERYSAWAEGRQKAYACWKSYIIKQLVRRFGTMKLHKFNTHLLEQFQSERLKKGNKPATVNRLIAVISHMFTKAVDWEIMDKAVASSIRVKMLPENNRRLRYLSKEECQGLINACEPHLRPIVITALNTGMRRGEILGLRWDTHIDLKHGFILLDQTKNGERREIPINATLKTVLQGLTRRLDIPHVFYDGTTGRPYKDMKKSFKTALRRAGIRDFHFHDLRHTFASQLVMAGVDITTVKELLGHKTLTMTLRYAHLAPSHKVKAVGVLDRKLTGNYHSFITVDGNGVTPISVSH
ncbi:MAG: tyrosine-type recombinase/integrase [Nitrospirae bacterium]|nr:tyrosine-type recombinase/integrase [Nitrospirota bacterium]